MQQKTAWITGIILVVIAIFVLYYFSAKAPVDATTAPGGDTSAVSSTTDSGSNAGNVAAPTGTVGRKPVVTVTGFASVTNNTAVVVGTVIPEGSQTTYWFQYGPTLDLGSSTEENMVPAGQATVGAAAYIKGLKPSTQYYFRVAAKNAAGIVYSGPYNFITNAK